MHDAHGVRRGEPAHHAVDLRGDLGERPRAGARDQVGYGAAFGEFHCVPRDVATTIPVINRDDGRVRELRGEPRLTAEATDGALVARHMRVQQLERHLAAEGEVAHPPHGTERPRAEWGDHLVVIADGPAETHLRRLAFGRGVLAAQREHGAAPHDAIHRAQHGGDGREPLRGIGVKRAVEHGRYGRGHVRAQKRHRRDVAAGRGLASQGMETERRELPLVARRGWQPALAPLGGQRHLRGVGRQALRHLVEGDGPLPADHPDAAHGRGEHAIYR